MHDRGIAMGPRTRTRWATGLGFAAVAGVLALTSGCTWVKVTTPGEGVRVGTMSQAMSCKKVGAAHAKTSPRAWIFSRDPKTIDLELENLARNEAGTMGGDLIVPQGPTSSEGRRSFDVFHCSGP